MSSSLLLLQMKSEEKASKRRFSAELNDDVCFFHNHYANQQLLALIFLPDTHKLLQTYISQMKRKYSEMFVFSDITEPPGLGVCVR